MKIHQPGNQRARGYRAVRRKAFERVLPERFDRYVEFSSASREAGDNLGSSFGRREIDERIGMLEVQHVVEINENQQAMNEFEFAFRFFGPVLDDVQLRLPIPLQKRARIAEEIVSKVEAQGATNVWFANIAVFARLAPAA